MIQLLNILYVIAAVVFLFGAAIFVHEFGHYWVARRRGMKVEEFAIGFGPKIFGWRKDGIDYSWRWIPAGGYVKLPQMITSEALEGTGGTPAEKIPPASPWSRILVAFAGPLMNVVFAFVIATFIYFVGLPMLVNPSIIGYVDPKSDEYKLGIREGDQIVGLNGKLIRSWQDVHLATILAQTNVFVVDLERKGEKATYQLTALSNPSFGWKMLNLDPADHPEVVEVKPDGAGAEAKLQLKDIVVSFAGVPIASQQQLIELIRKRGGEPTDMKVKRGHEELTLRITPRLDPSTKLGRIGVGLGDSSKAIYRLEKPGPAPWVLIGEVLEQMKSTFSALAHSKETGVGAKDLSGPVGILAMLGSQVNTDYRLALKFLVLLNINLAILNLLPIPVLDGGHILLAIIEKIRRRPVNVRIQEYATTAFALLLISFMVYVTFFDIKRIPLFKSMFTKDSQIESAEKPSVNPAPAPAK